MNKSSLDRGFGRCVVLKKYGTVLKKYPNRTADRIVAAERPAGEWRRRCMCLRARARGGGAGMMVGSLHARGLPSHATCASGGEGELGWGGGHGS
jgi:hypothetical protein